MKLKSEDIFDKIIQFADTEGWSKMTVRSISKQIGYSTIKIYSDYGSKENLLLEIKKEGFRKIQKQYVEAASEGTSNVEKLIRISCAHVHFSFKNMALYDLMFSLNGADCQSKILTEKRSAAQSIRRFIDPLHQHDKNTIFLQYFALIHGLAIVMRDVKVISGSELEQFVSFSIRNFIKGIS